MRTRGGRHRGQVVLSVPSLTGKRVEKRLRREGRVAADAAGFGRREDDQLARDQREWDGRRDAQLDRGREKWIFFSESGHDNAARQAARMVER